MLFLDWLHQNEGCYHQYYKKNKNLPREWERSPQEDYKRRDLRLQGMGGDQLRIYTRRKRLWRKWEDRVMWYYSLLIRYVCQLDGFLLCPKFCQQCKQAFDRFHCYVFFDVLPTFWACAARIESDSISIHPPTRGPFGTHVRFFGFLLSLRVGFSMYVTFPCFATQIGMFVGQHHSQD